MTVRTPLLPLESLALHQSLDPFPLPLPPSSSSGLLLCTKCGQEGGAEHPYWPHSLLTSAQSAPELSGSSPTCDWSRAFDHLHRLRRSGRCPRIAESRSHTFRQDSAKRTCTTDQSSTSLEEACLRPGACLWTVEAWSSWFVPSPNKMPPPEVLGQRLWCCEADEDLGMEGAAQAGRRWPGFDVPGRWSIDRRHGDLGSLERLDDGGERFPDLS